MKNIKNKRGFTLLEVMAVVLIIGMVISTIMGILVFGYKVFGMTTHEHDLQNQVKISLEEISHMIRDSKGVFAIPDTGYYDEEWNYINVSDDGKTIQDVRWNPATKTHDIKILVGPFDDVTFKIGFDKQNSMSKDNTLRMYYEAYVKDGTVKRFDIKSGYVALNALQVVDFGTAGNPAEVLAYRNDNYTYDNYEVIVNVAFILDVSGSMAETLGDPRLGLGSRIKVLRERVNEIIEKFGQNQNPGVTINISLVPFSYHANNITEFKNVKTNKSDLTNSVSNLVANGGTNTGDGIRRAYHQINNKNINEDFPKKLNSPFTEIKNYVIILIDGDSNIKSYRFEKRSILSSKNILEEYFLGQGNVVRDPSIFSTGTFNAYTTSSSPRNGQDYALVAGALINKEGYTNYFINFGPDADENIAIRLNKAVGNTEENGYIRYFHAKDSDELGLSFSDIHTSITNDVWHYLGPNLIDPEG